MSRSFSIAVLLLALMATAGADSSKLRLGTSSSLESSGLAKLLLKRFNEDTGISMKVFAVGTGKALRLGREGAVDVVLVHSPKAELEFMSSGHGCLRRKVMVNDFVLVGPKADPAGIRGLKDAVGAFKRIYRKRTHCGFVSRGDDSGTHKKELELWQENGLEPWGKWYYEAGQGMEQVLRTASKKGWYTLVDRGSWLFLKSNLKLELLSEGDPKLFNTYHVIAVNPAKHRNIEAKKARCFVEWLTSVKGQEVIRGLKVEGQSLFKPVAQEAPKGSNKGRAGKTPPKNKEQGS